MERLKVEGEGNNRIAYFSDSVKVSLKDSTVTKSDYLLREKDFVAFPVVWKAEKTLAFYSKESKIRVIQIPEDWGKLRDISVFYITTNSEVFLKKVTVNHNQFKLKLETGIPYIVSVTN